MDPDGMPRLAAEMSPVESGHQAILTASGEKVQVLRDTATFLDQSVRYEVVCEAKGVEWGDVNDACWGAGGRRVAAVGDDGLVRVWGFDIG